MKTRPGHILSLLRTVLFVLVLISGPAVWADDANPTVSAGTEESGDSLFTPDELDDLLAPIALYPDPLIAQILPAATFIDQIDEATRYVRQYGNSARIDDQPWDVSVKAIAHYPDVLYMMDRKYDWTVSLGQAFINQQRDVMDSIQSLRARAVAMGRLKSTPQQQVITEDNAVEIVPAEPEMFYIPQYDPQMFFLGDASPSYGYITFGTGFIIGAWLNRECDWNRRGIYYHGWRGGGWIGRSRPHVHIRNSIYVNTAYASIATSSKVIRHDTGRYRERIRNNVQIHQERGVPAASKGRDVRTRERIGNGNVPLNRTDPGIRRPQSPAGGETIAPVRPPPSGIKAPQRPDAKDIYRGREIKSGQSPASYTGYGGYGSSREAGTIRERGQISRESMRQFTSRPDLGGGRQSAPPTMRQAPPVTRQAPAATAPARREERR